MTRFLTLFAFYITLCNVLGSIIVPEVLFISNNVQEIKIEAFLNDLETSIKIESIREQELCTIKQNKTSINTNNIIEHYGTTDELNIFINGLVYQVESRLNCEFQFTSSLSETKTTELRQPDSSKQLITFQQLLFNVDFPFNFVIFPIFAEFAGEVEFELKFNLVGLTVGRLTLESVSNSAQIDKSEESVVFRGSEQAITFFFTEGVSFEIESAGEIVVELTVFEGETLVGESLETIVFEETNSNERFEFFGLVMAFVGCSVVVGFILCYLFVCPCKSWSESSPKEVEAYYDKNRN